MASETFEICKGCFFKYRATEADISTRCSHHARRIGVRWNSAEGWFETTEVRDPPEGWIQWWRGKARLCDPYKGSCRKDDCIYAHGTNELDKWNEMLQLQRKACSRPISAAVQRERTVEKKKQRPERIQHHPSLKKLCSNSFQPPNTVHASKKSLSGPAISSENFKDRVQCVLTLKSITVELTEDNYKDKFQNLICWEEKTHIEILGKKCNSTCTLKLYPSDGIPEWIESITSSNMRCGRLEGLNQDQIAYLTQASEAAVAVSQNRKQEVRMKILKENFNHCNNYLYVSFSPKFESTLSQIFSQQIGEGGTYIMNVCIEFEVKHLYFNSLIKAVNDIRQVIIKRIVPSRKDFLPFSTIDEQLRQLMLQISTLIDKDQSLALMKILTCNSMSPPLLVNGSFGTGKTRILASAAYYLVLQGRQTGRPTRILVCAHHQATPDTMVQKYFGPMLIKNPGSFELIRLTSFSHHLDRKHNFKKYYVVFEELSDSLKQSQFLIVATTYNTSASLKMYGKGFFTHILLDEGSQIREPDAITPLCLASPNTKLVIAGDTCQVGPALLVLGEEAHENGLKYSLLERLSSLYSGLGDAAQEHMVHLNTNYRCHEKIVELPSSLFYEKRIIPRPIDAQSHPKARYPFVFVCSSLDYNVEPIDEARVLLESLQDFVVRNWPREWGSKDLTEVAFVAASRTQVVHARRIAKKEYHNNYIKYSIIPSYSIQGKEFRAVFVSTVEPLDSHGRTTNPTRSLCNRYVFTTVITRSKSLVVAAGSPLALLRTEQQMDGSLCWKNYMRRCMENGTFFIPSCIEHSQNKKVKFITALKAVLYGQNCGSTSKSRDMSFPLCQTVGNSNKPSLATRKWTDVVKSSKYTTTIGEGKGIKGSQTKTLHPLETSSHWKRKGNKGGIHGEVKKKIVHSNHLDNEMDFDETEFPTLKAAAKMPKPKEKPHILTIRISPLKLCMHSDSFYEFNERLESEKFILEEELTIQNYRSKFHFLLCLEEREHSSRLERYNGFYMVKIYDPKFRPNKLFYETNERQTYKKFQGYKRYGCIDSEDGDALSHVKQASEGSYIQLEDLSYVHAKHVNGKAHQSSYNAILIAFDDEQLKIIEQSRFCHSKSEISAYIKFELKHSYFQRLHNAISQLPDEIIPKLNPTTKETSLPIARENFIIAQPPHEALSLDKEGQMRALDLILKSMSSFPILIAGPFGTGKTRLLARAAYDSLRDRKARVLICAHHHVSVDTFIKYFAIEAVQNIFKQWKVDIIRVLPNGHYHSEVKEDFKHFFKMSKYVTTNDLRRCRLVVTTFGIAPALAKKMPDGLSFSHILIDESAQSREPETIGPLVLANANTKIVLAGDHCQVGPNLLVLGEEARKYKLNISLLERLHNIYDEANRSSHSSTLLTNYRCHNGILMLPSTLFYESSLQCRVPDNESHPDAPFPLKFVCSSLDQHFSSVSGTNSIEARVLLAESQSLFQKWPRNWDEEGKKVCIISPSPNQCAKIRREIYKYKLDCGVEVLKAYEIQGTEFQAIFISTSEPTSEDGHCVYETKSICDRYVFNTVITRSKSLVVAVGNPLLLLEIEEQMAKKYNQNCRCWLPYIKQCIECNTFSFSEHLQGETYAEAKALLFDRIYSRAPFRDFCMSQPLDSILKSYKRALEQIKECKHTSKIILSCNKGARMSWKIEEYEGSEEVAESHSYRYRYECILYCDTRSKGRAIPIDGSRIVKIQGEKHRKGAFDGDTVEVGVFDDSPPDQHYGKVLEVLKRGGNMKFVCRVSTYNPIIFHPIDRKNPVLINLPRISKDLLKKKDIQNIKTDLVSTDVVVFHLPAELESEEIENVPVPKIKHVIPLSVAKNMLFMVSFVKWEHKYRNPLGIVTEVYPKGFTYFHAERLLQIQHSVCLNNEENGIINDVVQEDKQLQLFSEVFTIDPEGAQNLDDALSIIEVEKKNSNGLGMYEVGVHIVNAAKHIQLGEPSDKKARNIGTSVYGNKSKGKVMHMLSSKTLRSQMSLTPGKIRDVLSVIWTVSLDLSHPDTLSVSKVDIMPAQVKSTSQLTYSTAQQILEGRATQESADSAEINSTLFQSMKLLFTIAFAMRLQRLKSDAAYVYDVSDPGEESCWQAHLLVEELMIWANNEVAKRICSFYPNAALLRRQPPPNHDNLNELIGEHKTIMENSLKLSKYLDGDEEVVSSSILMPLSILEEILKALEEGNMTKLKYYVTTCKSYPQLAALEAELYSICLRADYCCTEEHMVNSSKYHHSSLNLDKYTHFSSPMRRYMDIQVQRMLLESLKEKALRKHFSQKEHKELCVALNKRMNHSKEFEKAINQVCFSLELQCSSKVYTAFIVNSKKKFVELQFPHLELKHFPAKSKQLIISHMSLCFSIASLTEINIMDSLKSYSHITMQTIPMSGSSTNLSGVVTAVSNDSEESLSYTKYGFHIKSLGVEIPSNSWKRVLDLVKTPLVSHLGEKKDIFNEIFKVPLQHDTASVSLDELDKKWLYIKCDIEDPWKSPGILKVWLSWSMREHIITPIVQLVEVSPLFRFCIQHNSHPAECFSDPNLFRASKTMYKDIYEYVNLWKKVILAEAAEASVKDSKPSIIRDASLEWPKLIIPKECIHEVYYIPSDTVKMIIPSSFVDNCLEFFQIKQGSFICVRCEDKNKSGTKAVFHFVVHAVEDDSDNEGTDDSKQNDITVCMESIGKVNCRLSKDMLEMLDSKLWNYEVQIIPMSVSYGKVFGGLLRLQKKSSKLSKCVAVDIRSLPGSTRYPIDKLMEVVDEDPFVKSISQWSSEPGKKLNKGQEHAMDLALKKPFQLIQGPPGTGKSEIGAHIAYVFAVLNQHFLNESDGHKCVFYCGPSNKSVDVVLEKFVDLLNRNGHLQDSLKILRIYSSSVERKYNPDPYNKPLSSAKCPNWAEKFSLHYLLRNANDWKSIPTICELRELEEKIKKIKSEKKIPSGLIINKHRKLQNKAEIDFLKGRKFDIVFCTCNEAAGKRARYFSLRQCIIDESGMAHEPETIVPLRFCEHAILIGDHKQLQPVINYGPAKICGLSTSLFERYAMEYGEKYTYTLKTQYRMHEKICEFPSKHFYNDELETDSSVITRTNPETRIKGFWPKGSEVPIVFVDVAGEEDEYRRSEDQDVKVGTESKSNAEEAKKVVEIVRVLHCKHKVPNCQIAVLTPYKAQKEKIKDKLKQGEPDDLKNIQVESISESQGNEYGIVLLSTVRSQPVDKIKNKHLMQKDHIWLNENLGFITDKHQINVGITRSKYGLIIIGNKILLSYDDTWESLINYYEDEGCIVEGSKFPL